MGCYSSGCRVSEKPKAEQQERYAFESLPFELESGANVGSGPDSGAGVPGVGESVFTVGAGIISATGVGVATPARYHKCRVLADYHWLCKQKTSSIQLWFSVKSSKMGEKPTWHNMRYSLPLRHCPFKRFIRRKNIGGSSVARARVVIFFRRVM